VSIVAIVRSAPLLFNEGMDVGHVLVRNRFPPSGCYNYNTSEAIYIFTKIKWDESIITTGRQVDYFMKILPIDARPFFVFLPTVICSFAPSFPFPSQSKKRNQDKGRIPKQIPETTTVWTVKIAQED
jgi:hypothetical protein